MNGEDARKPNKKMWWLLGAEMECGFSGISTFHNKLSLAAIHALGT
jgi:hypothetical protein